jgi:hypothetical protein
METVELTKETGDKPLLINWNDKIELNPIKKYDCIVLDLDGTLVDSTYKNRGNGILIKYSDYSGDPDTIWVHKRPGFDNFLEICFKLFTVGVWSMGQPSYVEAIVKLFPQPPAFIYNWTHCDRDSNRVYKRLKEIPYDGNILMIDDKADILELCDRVDTLIVPEWNPRCADDTILSVLAHKLQIS